MSEIMSEEEYLVSQIVRNLKTDLPAAKSWMIFSRSVFPQSFQILLQCYKLNCEEKNINECALLLHELVKNFPHEATLIEELKCIVNALCFDNNDFYKDIFKQLSNVAKYNIMLAVTNIPQPRDEHCKVMLCFLKNLPDARFLQHGNYIIDMLLSAETELETWTPINKYRKILVNDVLPLVLKGSENTFKFNHLFHLLEKAIEFYVYVVFFHLNSENLVDEDITMSSEQLAMSSLDKGWKALLKLLETVALQCKWNHPELLFSNFNEQSLKNLISLLKKDNKLLSLKIKRYSHGKELEYEEAYFCIVTTFFYYLYTFGRLIHSSMFWNSPSEPYNYILMEGVSFSPDDCYSGLVSSDFVQNEKGFFFVSKCGSKETSNMLICSFVTAADCWELLHQNSQLKTKFEALCANIKVKTWPVFQEFEVSLLLCKRAHEDVINYLRKVPGNTEKSDLKLSLQVGSSYYFLKKYKESLAILFNIVMNLPPEANSASTKVPVIKSSVRYLYFMGCNSTEIIQYCVSVLLKLYKCKWHLIPDSTKSMAVAYMLVLLQYDMDHEYAFLKKCIKYIKKEKTFHFPRFFNYIINVYILEEISYLSTPLGGNVKLEILPGSESQANDHVITRSVNEMQYDDLKHAFISQMARCNESLDCIYIEFIRNEQNFLLIPLANCI